MTAARALLDEAAARGVRVNARDGELKVAYRGEPPRDLLDRLRAHKPDLLRELAPSLEQRRAAVAVLLDAMAEETAARSQWWREPPKGWPDRLNIRSVLTGEVTTIRLQRKESQ